MVLSDQALALFVLFLFVNAIIVIDIHYIGISAILFYGHPRASFNERVLATISVGAIRSNCFGSERIQLIRPPEGAFDSLVAITVDHLQIGRRLLSYHYQVNLRDIEKVDFLGGKESTYVMKIYLARGGKCCEIHVDLPVWSHKKDLSVRSFVNTLVTRVQKD